MRQLLSSRAAIERKQAPLVVPVNKDESVAEISEDIDASNLIE